MKILQSCLMGILFALSTSYTLVTISVFERGGSITGEGLLVQLCIAVVMGIAIGAASLIFTIEKLPLTVATVIHFSVVTVINLIAGIFGDWFENTQSVITVFIAQVIVYIIIWAVIYILNKREIESINTLLQEGRNKEDANHH